MQIDFHFVRHILQIQAKSDSRVFVYDIPDDLEKVEQYFTILEDYHFIETKMACHESDQGSRFCRHIANLLPSGWDFLDNSKNEKCWKRFLKKVPADAGLDTANTILKDIVMRNYLWDDIFYERVIQIATLILAALGVVIGLIALFR